MLIFSELIFLETKPIFFTTTDKSLLRYIIYVSMYVYMYIYIMYVCMMYECIYVSLLLHFSPQKALIMICAHSFWLYCPQTHLALHIMFWSFPVAQMVKNLPVMRETSVQFLGLEDPLEEGMATHSSILMCSPPGSSVHETLKARMLE